MQRRSLTHSVNAKRKDLTPFALYPFALMISLPPLLRFSPKQLLGLATVLMVLFAPVRVHAFKVEAGTVNLPNTASNHVFTEVNFRQTYSQVPVVLPLATDRGVNPTELRIRDITTTGFKIAQVEPSDENGQHIDMDIDYVAIEPGVHEFPDGTLLEAGTLKNTTTAQAGFTSSTGWESVTLSAGFPSKPAVITHLQTTASEDNNPPGPGESSVPFLATAVTDVDSSGFETAIERAESQNGDITDGETIGYLAIQDGVQGTFADNGGNTVKYEGLVTGANIKGWDDGCFTNNFGQSYTGAPVAVAALNTRNGGDGGWLRRCSLSSTEIGLRVDEDRDEDNERFHASEEAGVIAFSRSFDASIIPADLLVEYRMDESAWSGPDSVLDATGKDRHASPVNGASPDDVPLERALSGKPGTCGYGTFNGTDQEVEDPNAGNYLNGLSAVTVSAWVYNTDDLSGNNRGIFLTDEPQQVNGAFKDFRLGLRYDVQGFNRAQEGANSDNVIKASVHTTACDTNKDCVQVETKPNVMDKNTWQHVTMTWEQGGDLRVYVDGTDVTDKPKGDEGHGTDGTLDAINGLRIGQGAQDQRWQGRIDEFRIYNKALSPSDVRRVYQDTHSCADNAVPDHIRLLHPGSGLTCSASTITVKACANSSCTDLFGDEVDVDFLSPSGNWSTDPETFTGQTDVSLQVTSEGPVTLDAASTPAAENDTECSDGSTDTCELVIAEAGFDIDIPDHVAARTVNGIVAAVKADPNDPKKCVPGFENEDKEVELWSDYVNPTSGTKQVSVNGSKIETSDPDCSMSPDSCPMLEFDSNGEATIDVSYPDAGKVKLNALHEGNSGDPDEGLTMAGNGNFIVRPDRFDLSFSPALPSPRPTDATGNTYVDAGEGFEITVNALNVNGDPTPNFGGENQPEGVDLVTTLQAPTGGNDPNIEGSFGTFGNDCAGNAAPKEQACGEFSWPEVGIIRLKPQLDEVAGDRKYLGTEKVEGDAEDNIGRFSPDHFAFSGGNLTNRAAFSCTMPMFTYIGERFDGSFVLTAKNTNDKRTKNYRGNYARLNKTGELNIGGFDAATDTDLTMALNVENADISSWIDATTGTGVGSADIDNVQLRLPRTTTQPPNQGPFEDFRLGTAPQDDDGVVVASFDLDFDTDGTDDHRQVGAATELRFGRLLVEDAFGSEIAPIPQPIRAEYWSGNTWKVNRLDDCTEVTLPAEVELLNNAGTTKNGDEPIAVDSGMTDISEPSPVSLSSGTLDFTFSEPRAENTGWVETTILLDDTGGAPNEHPYLRTYDDDTGDWTANPTGRVTFGIFAGEREHIYLREVFPAP